MKDVAPDISILWDFEELVEMGLYEKEDKKKFLAHVWINKEWWDKYE